MAGFLSSTAGMEVLWYTATLLGVVDSVSLPYSAAVHCRIVCRHWVVQLFAVRCRNAMGQWVVELLPYTATIPWGSG